MVSSSPGNDNGLTRQDKRAEKLRKKRARMKQHGKGLGQMYQSAVEKRGKEK